MKLLPLLIFLCSFTVYGDSRESLLSLVRTNDCQVKVLKPITFSKGRNFVSFDKYGILQLFVSHAENGNEVRVLPANKVFTISSIVREYILFTEAGAGMIAENLKYDPLTTPMEMKVASKGHLEFSCKPSKRVRLKY